MKSTLHPTAQKTTGVTIWSNFSVSACIYIQFFFFKIKIKLYMLFCAPIFIISYH